MDASACTLTKLVMPGQTNSQGTIFGGTLLAMIDEAAAIVARRRCRRDVVTAHIDSVDFEAPIVQGQLVEVTARLVEVGRTSMTVDVEAVGENLRTGERWRCTTARVVLVAIDEHRHPTPVA